MDFCDHGHRENAPRFHTQVELLPRRFPSRSCRRQGAFQRRVLATVGTAAVIASLVNENALTRSHCAFVSGPPTPLGSQYSQNTRFRKWGSDDNAGNDFLPYVTRAGKKLHGPTDPDPESSGLLDGLGTQVAVLALVGVLACSVIAGGYIATQNARTELSGKFGQEQIFQQWYSRAAEASKKATRLAQRAQETLEDNVKKPSSGPTKVPPTVVERIRGVSQLLDFCQQDLYDELWMGLATYPGALQGNGVLFKYYIENAYPNPAVGSPEELLRSALLSEANRFQKGAEEFGTAVYSQRIRDCERAFADMSLAYDRFLKAGNLYAGYDPVTSTAKFYQNIDDSQLVYTPLSLEQPRIRDEILVIRGPDKGKVGRVIWLGRNGEGNPEPDKVVSATVKLDANPLLGGDRGQGVKEVKAYPYSWIAVTRTSQQNFLLDILLGGLAALFSCALTYPLDSLKSRIQAGLPLLPESGIPGLFSGLTFNLLREVPNQALYMAGFNLLTRQFCLLPGLDANNPNLKLLVMVPAGVLGNLSGTFIRAPFEVLNKQMQNGLVATEEEAFKQFINQPREKLIKICQKSWVLCVVKSAPFGAIQCTLYEFFKDRLELVSYGLPLSAQPFVWGALAGIITGVITNPPDVVLTKVTEIERRTSDEDKSDDVLGQLAQAANEVYVESGVGGFFRGASARAAYFAPEACLWFAAYEILKDASDLIAEV